MLRPPLSDFRNMPLSTRLRMSLRAVSVEHLAIFAHLPVVSFPKNPSNSMLISFRCLSLNDTSRLCSQNSALRYTADSFPMSVDSLANIPSDRQWGNWLELKHGYWRRTAEAKVSVHRKRCLGSGDRSLIRFCLGTAAGLRPAVTNVSPLECLQRS